MISWHTYWQPALTSLQLAQSAPSVAPDDPGPRGGALSATLPEAYADTTAPCTRSPSGTGRPGLAATFSATELPTRPSARSGDMGEGSSRRPISMMKRGYVVGPSRLIHRDHQEWAMRGDDRTRGKEESSAPTVGCGLSEGEAKSRPRPWAKTLSPRLAKAWRATARCRRRNSLAQFANRLLSTADSDVGDAILEHAARRRCPSRPRRSFDVSLPTSSDPQSARGRGSPDIQKARFPPARLSRCECKATQAFIRGHLRTGGHPLAREAQENLAGSLAAATDAGFPAGACWLADRPNQ